MFLTASADESTGLEAFSRHVSYAELFELVPSSLWLGVVDG